MAKGLENKEQANELISTYFGKKPVFTGFAQYILDVRRNLIALSFGALTYKLSEAEITAVQVISYLNIQNIKSDFIDRALFWYLWYNLSHFFIEVFITYKSFQMLTKQYQNNITESRKIAELDAEYDEYDDEKDHLESLYSERIDISNLFCEINKKNIKSFLSMKKYLKTCFTDVLVPIALALWAIYCVSPYQLISKLLEIILVLLHITLSLLFAIMHCKLKFMMT